MNRRIAAAGLSAAGLFSFSVIVAAQSAASAPAPASAQQPPAGPAPMAPVPPPATGTQVTFSKDVAPILYRNCTSCHRPGTTAPMSLLTFTSARPYAKSIRNQVMDRQMPPWHADPHIGTFANTRALSDADRQTLITWANTGSPEGHPADLPPMPTYADAWSIGTPDLIVGMLEEYEVPADGAIDYQYFEAPSTLTEDRWIDAMEIRSTGLSVVHHVAVTEMPPPESRQPRERLVAVDPKYFVPAFRTSGPEGARGPLLMLSAGGTGPQVFRPGTGRLIKAGTTIIFQVHYTTNGQKTKDRTSIGFRFAKQPPKEEIRLSPLANANFVIPPGAPDHRVDAEMTFIKDVKLRSIVGHAHLRGKSFTYTLQYPDGRQEVILSIPEYDFDWQTEYVFAEPLRVPRGTKLLATALFDNSRANRDNPDPTAEVRWGEQTWEEMMFSWFTYSADTPATPLVVTPSGAR